MEEQLKAQLVKHIDEAYAMEQNVLRMLDSMIGTTKDPQMKRSLERHRKQTEMQAERPRTASPSTASPPRRSRRPAACSPR